MGPKNTITLGKTPKNQIDPILPMYRNPLLQVCSHQKIVLLFGGHGWHCWLCCIVSIACSQLPVGIMFCFFLLSLSLSITFSLSQFRSIFVTQICEDDLDVSSKKARRSLMPPQRIAVKGQGADRTFGVWRAKFDIYNLSCDVAGKACCSKIQQI